MKELNKKLLDEAIKKLPSFEPKTNVWDAIDMELTILEQEAPLKVGIAQLPEFDPPASIWEGIESGLENEQRPTGRVFNIRKWASVAAVFAMISIGALFIYNSTTTNAEAIVSVTHSEEQINTSFLQVDWEEGEDAFAMVADFCKTDHVVCKQPDFKILTDELDELNAAKEELKYAMDNYGNDPDLIAQLTAIEHERSDLLKKIIKRI